MKDAQRHGLRFRPIDVTCSNWECHLEKLPAGFAVRLGMRYVKGLRAETGREIARQRAICKFASIEELKRRVPGIQKAELTALAAVGALNFISGERGFHRRDALWQVERAARNAGPLLEELAGAILESMAEEIPQTTLAMAAEEKSTGKARPYCR